MIGYPTPGEQYLTYIGLDDHPRIDDLTAELDDEIAFVAEQIVREWKARDPLLRALLDEDCLMWVYATYPARRLPAGTRIRVNGGTYGGGVWHGQLGTVGTGLYDRTFTVVWDRNHDQMLRQAPSVHADTEVEALVPVPFDLSPLAGPTPAPALPPTPPAPPAVTWDDLAEGQIIRFWYHNRSQRLARRPARAYLARVRHVQRPEPLRNPRVQVEVLKADLTRHHTIGYHTIFCGEWHGGLADIIEIVQQPPAAVQPQDLTGLTEGAP